jgi:uncharacterized protein (TIGR02271 family)
MAYETNAPGVGTTMQVIVGLFNNGNDAHQALTQLRANGFSSGQIGAAFRGASQVPHSSRKDYGTTKSGELKQDAESWWEKVKDAFRSEDKVETRREEATTPTLGNEYDSRAEYEYDYRGDDFEGSLAGAGITSDRAAYLSRNLQPGGALVTVRDTERAAEAEQILSANHGKVRYEDAAGTNAVSTAGAEAAHRGYPDVDPKEAAAEAVGFDAAASTGRETTDSGYADRRPVNSENASVDRVQLFGEVLRVHKERISRGEVRVRKDVVTENQTIEVPVTREELVLERVSVPANTPAPSASIGQAQEIRVPLTEEAVRVEKQPVVREEVMVGKREVSDVAQVGDEVRHEELRVDNPDTTRRAVTGQPSEEDTRRRG